MRVEDVKKMRNSFCFLFDDYIAPGETVVVIMPRPNSNQRGINDIGWQCDSNALRLYGTLAAESALKSAIWQEIDSGIDVNCTTNMLKAVNEGETKAHLTVRVSLF